MLKISIDPLIKISENYVEEEITLENRHFVCFTLFLTDTMFYIAC